MQIESLGATEHVAQRLEQIMRELRLHNEREERREQEAAAAAAASKRRFAGL